MRSLTRVLVAVGVFASPTVLNYALYYFLLFAAYDFKPEFLEIDRCLDRGGRWNDQRGACDESASELDRNGRSLRLTVHRRGEEWGL